MGNMFRCTLKSGGASGTGIPLIVTCSEDFAGKTITATDGTTTLTETCPSTSPYTVQFDLPNTGSWTISGVIEGVTYSETISVTEYQLELNAGFDFKTWVSLGGLDPDDYASLSAVFADEAAVRRLMLVHASADYLIDCVTDHIDDIDDIDDFCANDTAMKWLGLCDYVCDGLAAITGVEAKLLASTYWERYLKDRAPVMTSDSAPYGAAISSGYTSGYNPYRAFDGNSTTEYSANNSATSGGQWLGFKFTNPISVRKIFHLFQAGATSTVKVQYSDDGTNYTDTGDTYTITRNIDSGGEYIDVTESGYHLYWRVYCTSSTAASDFGTRTLQFYGRALNVSVPVMTSNTAPYGEAFADSESSASYAAWKAFDADNNSYAAGTSKLEHYWGYVFPSDVKVKMAMIYSSSIPTDHMYIESADSKTGTFSGEEFTAAASANYTYFVDLSNVNANKAIRLRLTKSTNFNGAIGVLQFYGVDYSEKEFEAGTTKKWLYDHGVLLDGINFEATAYNTQGGTTSNEGYPFAPVISDNTDLLVINQNVDSSNHSTIGQLFIDKMYDLTNYSNLFYKVEKARIYDSNHAYQSISVYITSAKANYYPPIAQFNIVSQGGTSAADVSTGNKLMNIDVSSINQTEYLLFYLRSVGLLELSEFWLE